MFEWISVARFRVLQTVRRLSLVVAFLMSLTLSGCSFGFRSQLDYQGTSVTVYGPARGFVEDGGGDLVGDTFKSQPVRVSGNASGTDKKTDEPPGNEIWIPDRGSYEAQFQVIDLGPIFLRVAHHYGGEGIWAESRTSSSTFFAIAPPGATMSLAFKSEQDPEKLRLHIDRDSDGKVDEKLSPLSCEEGDDVLNWESRDRSEVEELADGRVRVTLQAAAGDGTSLAVRHFYALYSPQGIVQTYDEPFIVDRPSYLLYGAFSCGVPEKLHGIDLLGGLGPDVVIDLSTDGSPVPVEFTVPGQLATLRYPATAGDQLEYLIEEATIDALGDESALGASQGSVLYLERRETKIYEMPLDLHWGYTGTVLVRMTDLNEHALPVEVGGPPVRDEFWIPGQNGEFNFDGIAQDELELTVADLEGDTLDIGGFFEVNVYAPSGSALMERKSVRAEGGSFTIRLPETGRYRVELDPIGSGSSATIALRTIP